MNMQIDPTTFAEPLRPAPTEPNPAVRDAFFEIDDALGHLSNAIDVIRIVAEGSPTSMAVKPLVNEYQRLRDLVDKAWPSAVGRASA